MFSNYNIRSLEDHSENGKTTVNVENPREIKLISSNSSGKYSTRKRQYYKSEQLHL